MELVALIVALAAILVFICIVVVTSGKGGAESFRRRFPPLSDAEFVARCTPGTDPAVALRVRRMIADWSGVEYERIHPSLRFVDDLGRD
jgi:hypothetical protein